MTGPEEDASSDADPEELQARVEHLEDRIHRLESFLDENFPARWRTRRSDARGEDEPSARFRPLDEDTAEPTEEPAPTAQPRPSRTQDTLESRIGGNLLAKVGVLVLVLGLAFFVAYAIESGLIGLRTRIILGVLGGLGVAWGGHQLRDHPNYGTLAQVGAGGGFALAYFSIFAAHHFPTYQALFGIGLLLDSLLLALLAGGILLYAVRVESGAFLVESLALGFVTAFLAAELTLFTLTYTTLMALAVSAAAVHLDEHPVALLAVAGTYVHALLTGFILQEHTAVVTAVALDAVAFGAFASLVPSLREDGAEPPANRAALYGVNAALALAVGTAVAEAGNVLPDGRFPLLAGFALLAAAAALWRTQPDTAATSGLAGYAGLLVAAPLALQAQAFLLAWTVAYLALGLLPLAKPHRYLLPAIHATGVLLLVATLAQTPALDAGATWTTLGPVALAYGVVFASLARTRERNPDDHQDLAAGLHLAAGVLVLVLLLALELTALRLTLVLGLLGLGLVAWGLAAAWSEPRWAGLAVLGGALAKAFLYDVWKLPTGLRVVAFIGLGLALIAAAVGYARVDEDLNLGRR